MLTYRSTKQMTASEIVAAMLDCEASLTDPDVQADAQWYDRISEEHAALANRLDEVGMPDEVARIFHHAVTAEEIDGFTLNGITYVPFCGNRISPELADRRRAMETWSESACTAGYVVTFRRANSTAVSAMGRL